MGEILRNKPTRILSYLFFIFVLYIYIYNPIFQIIGFGLVKVLLIISIIYLILTKQILIIPKLFPKELFILLLIVCYIFPITSLIGDGSADDLVYTHIVWFLECFCIPLFLYNVFYRKMKTETIDKWLVIVGTIASLVTLFLIVNPSINQTVRSEIIVDTLDLTDVDWSFRGYSIAESSAFIYGVVQGMILAICFFSIRKSTLYIVPVLFIFVSILFNARTGIAITLVALLLLIIMTDFKSKSKLIFIFALFLIVFSLFDVKRFTDNNQVTLEWGMNFFEQTFGLLLNKNNDSMTYDVLFGDMFVLPEKEINFIFGEGIRKISSDMGYVNQMFSGGLVYLFLLFSLILYMSKRYYRFTKNLMYTVFFLLVLLIANTKGEGLIISTGFTRIIGLFYTYPIFDNFYNKKI